METYSLLSSSSEDEEENTTAKSLTDEFRKSKSNNSDDDGGYWKKALLARHLDTLHTCTLMIVTDISSSQRLHLSKDILKSLKDVKQIALDAQEDKSGACNWKTAVLARNLDLIDTSLHIVMMDVPMSFREQLGRSIVAALHDLEKVIQNDESPAEYLIHCRQGSKGDFKDNRQPKHSKMKTGNHSCYRGPQPAPAPPHDAAAMREMVMHGVCPICHRDLMPHSLRCPACRVFAVRWKERLNSELYEYCAHENNSGGVSCRSCRYNLYCMMMEEFRQDSD